MPTAPPSPEEMAAIAAAVELAWPRPAPAEDDEGGTGKRRADGGPREAGPPVMATLPQKFEKIAFVASDVPVSDPEEPS